MTLLGTIMKCKPLKLDEDEWEAIEMVTDWLKTFQSATSQMSGMKGTSTLSTTHTVFRGLQEHISDYLCPSSIIKSADQGRSPQRTSQTLVTTITSVINCLIIPGPPVSQFSGALAVVTWTNIV